MFFVLSYRFTVFGRAGLLPGEDPKFFTVEIPIALFAGITVYALHRALVYPWIEYLMDTECAKSRRNKTPLISKATADSLYQAWGMAAEKGGKEREYAKNLSGWADWAHFNYVSTLCVALGYLVGIFSPQKSSEGVACQEYRGLVMGFVIIVFFVAGFTSDWRNKRVRELAPKPPESWMYS